MGIVQPTQIVSHTEDILDESADFALLLAAAAYNQVVHELRIPIGETYLPVSAMTYSLYRRVFSHLQNPANPAIGEQWRQQTDIPPNYSARSERPQTVESGVATCP